MGVAYGTTTLHQATKGVVQDGLVLNLDAGVRDSYKGDESNWYNLKDRSISASLINTPSFDKEKGGSILLDGTNTRARIDNQSIASIGSSNHTISAWIKNTTNSDEDFVSTNVVDGGILLMVYQNKFRGHIFLRGAVNTNNTIDSPNAIGTGNWNYLTQHVDWNDGNIKLFENGSLVKTQSLVGSQPSSTLSIFSIGNRDGGTGNDFDGNVAIVHVYNRALTGDEIARNYNATRHRFGV